MQPAGPAPTAMSDSWVTRFWSFMVVSLSRQVQFAAVWAADDGPQRTVRANPATASRTRLVSAPVPVDDQPHRPRAQRWPGRRADRRGRGVGHGADGGVGGQRGLEVLAHLGDRDRVDRVDVARTGRRPRRSRYRPRPSRGDARGLQAGPLSSAGTPAASYCPPSGVYSGLYSSLTVDFPVWLPVRGVILIACGGR